MKLKFGERSVEGALRGRKGALKTDDGWLSTAAFTGDGGSPGRNPLTFLARHLSSFGKSPVVQATGLLKQTKQLVSDGNGVYSAKLTAEGVEQNVPRFGVEVAEPVGSVKFWTKDGLLVKYTYKVRANVTFLRQNRQVEYDRTTTVKIENIGATKLDLPEEAITLIKSTKSDS